MEKDAVLRKDSRGINHLHCHTRVHNLIVQDAVEADDEVTTFRYQVRHFCCSTKAREKFHLSDSDENQNVNMCREFYIPFMHNGKLNEILRLLFISSPFQH